MCFLVLAMLCAAGGNAFGATIQGILDIAGVGNVTVTATDINFAPTVLVTNSTGFFSAATPGTVGTIQSISSTTTTFPLSDFVVVGAYSFTADAPTPSSFPVCVGNGTDTSCTPFAGSPFTLTAVSPSTTEVGLSINGTVTDGVQTVPFTSLFSSNPTQSIPMILAEISAGVSASWSSEFSVNTTIGTVPEPGTSVLILGGLLMVGLGTLRRKSVNQ
jgi:hypothetical protein